MNLLLAPFRLIAMLIKLVAVLVLAGVVAATVWALSAAVMTPLGG